MTLNNAWDYIKQIDWHDPSFSLDKAYVCALFSELAYKRIAEFELDDANRVNVIPSLSFQQMVSSGEIIDFDTYIASFDFGDYFAVIRRYAIVVGVRTPNVIFVSIRGTKYLYDWLVNLRATKYCFNHHENTVCFHKGFFKAIYPCFEPISNHLVKMANSSDLPIYVTGHSLGGALAAIMHALWGMTIPLEHLQDGHVPTRISTHSSYTFGMPRYGNIHAVARFRTPFHLYNEKDIVPSVPPDPQVTKVVLANLN